MWVRVKGKQLTKQYCCEYFDLYQTEMVNYLLEYS